MLTQRQTEYLKTIAAMSPIWQRDGMVGSLNDKVCAMINMNNKQGYAYRKYLQAHGLLNVSGLVVTKKGENYLKKVE